MKIEEGCLAMVIAKGRNCGMSVIVGKYIGEIEGWKYNDIWNVDRPLAMFDDGIKIGYRNVCSERNLMRIDGLKEKQEKRETVKA